MGTYGSADRPRPSRDRARRHSHCARDERGPCGGGRPGPDPAARAGHRARDRRTRAQAQRVLGARGSPRIVRAGDCSHAARNTQCPRRGAHEPRMLCRGARNAARAARRRASRPRCGSAPIPTIVSRADRGLAIHWLDDPRLHRLRIAVPLIGDDGANPPPVHALARRGIIRMDRLVVVGSSRPGSVNRQRAPGARRIPA